MVWCAVGPGSYRMTTKWGVGAVVTQERAFPHLGPSCKKEGGVGKLTPWHPSPFVSNHQGKAVPLVWCVARS